MNQNKIILIQSYIFYLNSRSYNNRSIAVNKIYFKIIYDQGTNIHYKMLNNSINAKTISLIHTIILFKQLNTLIHTLVSKLYYIYIFKSVI